MEKAGKKTAQSQSLASYCNLGVDFQTLKPPAVVRWLGCSPKRKLATHGCPISLEGTATELARTYIEITLEKPKRGSDSEKQ